MEAFVTILVVAATIAVGVIGAYVTRGFLIGGRRFASVQAFSDYVAGATGLQASSSTHRTPNDVTEVRLSGNLKSGRLARVFFEPGSGGRKGRQNGTAHYCVSVDPAAHLDVTRETALERLSIFFGIAKDVSVGDTAFDKKFWVQSKSETRTKRAMDQGLTRLVEHLFNVYHVQRLRIEKGWLQVVTGPNDVDPVAYGPLLAWLEQVASTFDRATLPIKVLGGERKAFRDSKGGTRCAYCHGGITGEEPDLVACEQCHTVLHDECWHELNRCPLLGCTGSKPERTRTT